MEKNTQLVNELEAGEKNLRWFADNYELLQDQHPDEFVAIDQGVLETASSLDELLEKLKGKLDHQSVVIEHVPSRERILVI